MKALLSVLSLIIFSFYFFPFEFTFLPGVNTKMALAGIGVFLLGFRLSSGRSGGLDKQVFNLSIIAMIVSVIGFASTVINNTHDYSYATYIISMWVWLGGAYTVCLLLQKVYGGLDVALIGKFIVAVCASQCALALTMDFLPEVKDFVDSFLAGTGFMGKTDSRLYGIGCALDVAGSRFSCALVILVWLAYGRDGAVVTTGEMVIYALSFVEIFVIGNMMARTTLIGGLVAVPYVLWIHVRRNKAESKAFFKRRMIVYTVITVCVIAIVILYNVNSVVKSNIDFGFEGFFSLFRTGEWRTNSNDMLKNMVVYPETLHTWLIGDGYLENPSTSGVEPYYMGIRYGGFYKGTDIGYLRFIFYFGLTGLIAFSMFFIKATQICMKWFPEAKMLFFLIMTLNFIIWLKVSTDLFIVLALFIAAGAILGRDKTAVVGR